MATVKKAEIIRRSRELRKLLAELIEYVETPGPPGINVQPRASQIFEKSRSLERAAMAYVREKGKGGLDGEKPGEDQGEDRGADPTPQADA